jgi:hypothetical protein
MVISVALTFLPSSIRPLFRLGVAFELPSFDVGLTTLPMGEGAFLELELDRRRLAERLRSVYLSEAKLVLGEMTFLLVLPSSFFSFILLMRR